MCACHYRQVPTVPEKKTVSKTGRFRVGQRKKRLSGQIDESCTALVGTLIPPQKKKKENPGSKFKFKTKWAHQDSIFLHPLEKPLTSKQKFVLQLLRGYQHD